MGKIGVLNMESEKIGDYVMYKINKRELRKYVEKLSELADVDIRKLGDEDRKILSYITTSIEKLHSSPDAYNEFLGEVNKIFSGIKKFKPNTVAAFFIGCIDDDQNDGDEKVPIECNPGCINSIKNIEKAFPRCSKSVLYFNDGDVQKYGTENTKSACIYFNGSDNPKITRKQINEMKRNGIKKVKIYLLEDNGKIKKLSDVLDIDNITKELSKFKKFMDPPKDENENLYYWGVVILIGFIVIIIILLILGRY